jgi:hypothetical protein
LGHVKKSPHVERQACGAGQVADLLKDQKENAPPFARNRGAKGRPQRISEYQRRGHPPEPSDPTSRRLASMLSGLLTWDVASFPLVNFDLTYKKLFVLLASGVLEKGNHERCVRIFYDVAKIVHYRQERLRKPQLKMKEIASALTLVEFFHSATYRFDVSGELACNFGRCPEDQAVEYFEHSVMGEVMDSFGRKVAIEESGLRSLYKEKYTGKHLIATENYEPVRGKRLPWIRHVIEKAKSVYRVDEIVQGKFRRTFLYTAISSIPLAPKPDIAYFIVVVSEDRNGNLRFVTAYHVPSHNRFLSRIEPGIPVLGA